MRNLLKLRRRLRDFEEKVQRLKKAETELAALASIAPSGRVSAEIRDIQQIAKDPARVDEVEDRIRTLKEELDRSARASGEQSQKNPARHVFISYSAKDDEAAKAVCASLESRRIRCWMAPRDILPGQNWAESVINAIELAQVMVLVLSSSANSSSQVLSEVERASAKDIPIVALRLENMRLSRPLELFLGKRHWLDATKAPLETCLEKLGDAIERLV